MILDKTFKKDKDLGKSTEAKPVSTVDYYTEGETQFNDGRYTQAMEYFQAAIAEHPERENAYLKLAEVYLKMGKSETAKKTLFTLLSINPNNSNALSKISALLDVTHHDDLKMSSKKTASNDAINLTIPTLPKKSTPSLNKMSGSIQANAFTLSPPKNNETKYWRIDFPDGGRMYVNKGTSQCSIVAPGVEISYYRNQRIETPSWNGFVKPTCKKLVIPDKIEIEGKVYKTTLLDRYCFYGCSSISEIILPNGLLKIDYLALTGTHIQIIEIPETVFKMASDSFPSTLNTIKLRGNPPKIDVINGSVHFASYVMIPRGKKELYENAPYWQTMRLTTY